jgi:hypothetical protein
LGLIRGSDAMRREFDGSAKMLISGEDFSDFHHSISSMAVGNLLVATARVGVFLGRSGT